MNYSDANIEKMREIRILRILGIRDTGRRTPISCPFGHIDKTPSCFIYPDNSFHCYSCGAHGRNAIDFVMKLGYNFKEATRELAKYL